MNLLALATDYDGTIAQDGEVKSDTLAGLRKFAESGRRLILITGRELKDLLHVFPDIEIFDRVIAENGALLYCPQTRETRLLTEPAPQELVAALRQRGVTPLAVGECVIATWRPQEGTVLEVIRELGIERQITFNKGAVMLLPSGVTKASGLTAALNELELSALNVVAIGDAENDLPFLEMCQCSAAVANALDAVKQRVDIVMASSRGAGVVQLIDQILRDDLPTA
jgi:hydroxymethylpyrimidine pyrophosphatase-like HAD family hydrolase